jgi:hypothetical protein
MFAFREIVPRKAELGMKAKGVTGMLILARGECEPNTRTNRVPGRDNQGFHGGPGTRRSCDAKFEADQQSIKLGPPVFQHTSVKGSVGVQ